MIKKELRAFIEKRWNRFGGIDIVIAEFEGDNAIAFAKPLVLEAISPGDENRYIPEPTISLGRYGEGLLQSIVDQAWDLGIRPRYARETTPEVNAIKYHLEDMRTLVFKDKKKGGAA